MLGHVIVSSAYALCMMTTCTLVFGVGLIFTTFRETRRAADAATRTLHADRAWLTFKDYKCGPFAGMLDDKPVQHGLTFSALWQNTGRSPALNVLPYILNQRVQKGDPIPTFEIPDDGSRVISNPSTGAGDPVQTAFTFVGDEEANLIRNQALDWYVYSRIEYNDIFEPDVIRVSELCLKIQFNGTREENGQMVPNLFMSFVGKQNGVT